MAQPPVRTRRSTVLSGAATLSVQQWGDAESTIVALHPGVADSRVWNECVPTWVDAGRRVIAFDRRGFGSTIATPETHDDLVDLLSVLDAARVDQCVVVGNSRGGGLALDLAADHPGRVAGLVLIAPSVSGYDARKWPLVPAEAELDDEIAEAEAEGDLEKVNRLEVRYWLDGVEQPEGRVGGPARTLMFEMNGTALRADPIGPHVERRPIWPLLSTIDAETLVVVGEYDLPGIRQQCDELAAALPRGRLVCLSDTAHCPSLDQPTVLSDLVREFIADFD